MVCSAHSISPLQKFLNFLSTNLAFALLPVINSLLAFPADLDCHSFFNRKSIWILSERGEQGKQRSYKNAT